MIRFFDIFAGIGGFRSGLEKAGGFKYVGYCEIDRYAKLAYETLYDTESEVYFNDARKIEPEKLPDFDLISGGFHCQSFSIAGKRGGFADARGTLFFEIARIAAVKCATITPNAARMTEYDLKEMWKSPNGTIRAILDGTVFRTPIPVKCIEPCVKNWKKPITIARHAYGDVYKASEMKIPCAGKAELVFTDESGNETRELIHNFKSAGIIQGQHNIEQSIESFARSCFNYAIDTKQNLWFASKDTISKKYDHTFKDIFHDIYEAEYADRFKALGIEYFYTLIDDAVARVMKSEGGYIWACKNYDGDVMSDMISSAFGSLAMMTSVLVSPDGYYEYEAAHGTVQRHYYKHLKGEETSTNSVATIFAWTGALRKRGELDTNPELVHFADCLEKACIKTIESGKMTKDLALITTIPNPVVLNSENFIKTVRENLEKML